MSRLRVTHYRVGTNRSRTNPNAHRYFLQLSGSSIDGPAERAIIYFWPSKPDDTVGYIARDLLVGLLSETDFADWYDILRHERPLTLYYVPNRDEDESRIWHIGISNEEEPVGRSISADGEIRWEGLDAPEAPTKPGG